MTTTLVRVVLIASLAVASLTISNPAEAGFPDEANSGYICYSRYDPWASGYYGDFGGIFLMLYTQPSCQGSTVGWGISFSENATASFAYNIVWITEPAILAALIESLQRAAQVNQRVTVYVHSSHPSAVRFIRFHSD